MKILLCGHTGSTNHGCEAIIRSTGLILDKLNVDYVCATFDKEADIRCGLDKTTKLISYPFKTQFVRSLSFLHQKIANDYVWGNRFYYKRLLDEVKPDMVLNVGGDTYCYGIPWLSVALNIETQKRHIPTVFWGCSVEKSVFDNEIMKQDINRYARILSRESLSTEILEDVYTNKNHLVQACDPAFQLPMEQVELPAYFIEGNTLGINLSPVMVDLTDVQGSMVYKNVCNLIEYICAHTNMNICLIPHVYSVAPRSGDLKILFDLYEKYKYTQRISIVDRELPCTQLKYIISKCRFFIGARTHSMIAAYSNQIPALALSYSLKSRGLAKDILGNENEFAISWKCLNHEEQLKKYFCKYVLDREQDIRKQLAECVPAYKNSIVAASKILLDI